MLILFESPDKSRFWNDKWVVDLTLPIGEKREGNAKKRITG